MLTGDLVQVRESPTEMGALGIILEVDRNFYKIPRHMDRIHILWSSGSTTADPASYVILVSRSADHISSDD